MRRTRIVATIGTASADPSTIRRMIDAGMDVARIALAHGRLEDHLDTHDMLRHVSAEMEADLSILADLPGPKIRCAPFPDRGDDLPDGATTRLVGGTTGSSAAVLEVERADLVAEMVEGDRIALAHGTIELIVEETGADGVLARVIRGGRVMGRPGLQVPSDRLGESAPTAEDLRLVDAFVERGVDMIAVSFVRSAHDVRSVGVEPAPRGPLMVAKIETAAAIENLEGIIEVSGGVMVARGDLATDFTLAELPHLQKHIIRRCVAAGRPVITATQMLESMIVAPTPTRAEASDIANAVFDGSSALMLSGETAIGADPAAAVATMAEIITRADDEFDHDAWARLIAGLRDGGSDDDPSHTTTDALTMAACSIAEQLGARAIVCPSRTGFTARSVARFRPATPILAFSPETRTLRQLAVSWGIRTAATEERTTASDIGDDALRLARDRLGMESGDQVVVISGQSSRTHATDTLRVTAIP